jgi:hypothetical protein
MAATMTATISYTAAGNYVSATTLTLAPQTTPFTPPDSCTGAIWCPYTSAAMSTAKGCNQWDGVNSTNNYPFLDGCAPDGYEKIFYQAGWSQ